ncbi:hypothetical protein HOG48_06290 [Candidatus Peregrinibacteria bacterium]|jgi:hypothetical protein|nr:hypothetical protein [Candidatus Peregrinibacteria bacterium]
MSEVARDLSVEERIPLRFLVKKSLGDVILDIMNSDARESMSLAELVYKFSDIREINCLYMGRSYRVRFDCSEKIPKVDVCDIGSGRRWGVELKGFMLKRLYGQIASRLSLAVGGDKVCIAKDGVRGRIGSAFRGLTALTQHVGVGLHESMTSEEMTEFLGERLFDPHRESSYLKYIF